MLLRCEHVSKIFCRDLRRSLWYGVQDIVKTVGVLPGEHKSQTLIHPNDRPLREGEFWANKDISFEVRRGECVGLIGHNGAGKTTLLKMLNGLIKPDTGRIEIRGRVGSLIALGAGFNPILSGRENIYVNAGILGLSKREVQQKVDEIIDFAELADSIDSPVRNYSSGMQVRLGFAIAAVLVQPDVLMLDEVLAVGDIGFTVKCLSAVQRMMKHSAVVFVSHSMQLVSTFCTRVIVLEHGRELLNTTDVPLGIDKYFSMTGTEVVESGVGGAHINWMRFAEPDLQLAKKEFAVNAGEKASLELEFTVNPGVGDATLHFTSINESMAGVTCYPIQDSQGLPLRFSSGTHRVIVPLGKMDLRAGKYDFVALIYSHDDKRMLHRIQGLTPFRVVDTQTHWGQTVRPVTAIPV